MILYGAPATKPRGCQETTYQDVQMEFKCNNLPLSRFPWANSHMERSTSVPGGLVVRIWCFRCHSMGSVPGPGTVFCLFFAYLMACKDEVKMQMCPKCSTARCCDCKRESCRAESAKGIH